MAIPDMIDGFPTIGEVHRARDRVEHRQDLTALGAALGQPLPLWYGTHILAGMAIFEHGITAGDARFFLAVGDGEMDGLATLWINALAVDHTDTNIVHFHPGLEGELGVESAPGTRNQKVCSFIPSGWPAPFTWSRTAYTALKLKDDATAPNSDFHILGVYRGLRVRAFDNTGTQTAYAYSANPAWVLLDLLIRRWLKPNGKINEALITAEKAKIDFALLKAWADDCDVVLSDGKRWEAHVGITQQESLLVSLERVAQLGRAYWVRNGAKLGLTHDEARSPILTITLDDIADGSLEFPEKDLRALPTRFSMHFLSVGSGKGRGTIATTGTALNGSGTLFTQELAVNEAIELLDGAQSGEVRTVLSITNDTTAVLKTAFSVDQSGRQWGRPKLDFQEQTKQFIDEPREDELGRIIDTQAPVEVGNNSPERVERLGEYLRRRQKREKQGAVLIANTRGDALDLLPGDTVTQPDQIEGLTSADFEIEELTIHPDLSVGLFVEKYDASIFVDTAGPQQPIVASLPAEHFPLRGVLETRTGEIVYDPGLGDVGLVKATRMHRSGYRMEITTDRTGSNGTGAFVTVASWSNVKIPKSTSTYQGHITSVGGAGTAREARLKIGALVSNSWVDGEAVPKLLVVTGLTGGTTVSVELQARNTAVDGASIPHFAQKQDTDQAESHFS